MAKLSKDRIEETARKYDSAVIVDTGDPVFDKELKLTIHGSPMIDGRVRFNTQTFAIYNPAKNEMKKLFRPIYNSDGLLQSIVVDKLMKLTMKMYYMPTKDMARYLSMQEIMSELLPSIVVKDNDNAEKVHFDILHDTNFRVILDDNLIVENHSYKYMSMKERVELSIVYCSDNNKVHAMYDQIIKGTARYADMKLHPKFIRMHNLLDTKDLLKFHVYIQKYTSHFKLGKKKSYRKTLQTFLDFYPKEVHCAILLKLGVNQKVLDGLKIKEKIIEHYIDVLLKDSSDYDNYSFLNIIVEGEINTNENFKQNN